MPDPGPYACISHSPRRALSTIRRIATLKRRPQTSTVSIHDRVSSITTDRAARKQPRALSTNADDDELVYDSSAHKRRVQFRSPAEEGPSGTPDREVDSDGVRHRSQSPAKGLTSSLKGGRERSVSAQPDERRRKGGRSDTSELSKNGVQITSTGVPDVRLHKKPEIRDYTIWRSLCATSPHSAVADPNSAATAFQQICHDACIADSLGGIQRDIGHFAHHFGRLIPQTERKDVLARFSSMASAELVRYCTCLAASGPSGEEGWKDLFWEPESRQDLVAGIVGRALKEHVFTALLFGATEAQTRELERLEQEGADTDGFVRAAQRHARIVKWLPAQSPTPANTVRACTTLQLQLETLLLPLYNLALTHKDSDHAHATSLPAAARNALSAIIHCAARLSVTMRLTPDVVHYFPPTFKDEEFAPERMRATNIAGMKATSPFLLVRDDARQEKMVLKLRSVDAVTDEETVGFAPSGFSHEATRALVQTVTFPGCVAYRRGGGALGRGMLREEKEWEETGGVPPDVRRARMRDGEGRDADWGFRTRILCKGGVRLFWAKERKFEDGRGKRGGGYVELAELVGRELGKGWRRRSGGDVLAGGGQDGGRIETERQRRSA